MTVELPFVLSLQEAISEAAGLNFLEGTSWTDFPQLGCWHVSEMKKAARVVHSCFIPNALYAEGMATNLALWSILRVQWVRKGSWPDVKDKTMMEIIEERKRMASGAGKSAASSDGFSSI